MASKDLKMSKEGSAGKRKCVTIMIPQKPEIINRLESEKNQDVTASCNAGSSTIYNIKKQNN
jgi:hypothetical protein